MGSVDSVQAYPGDWPALDETPADCAAVQGDFVDPNRWRWAFEEFPGWPQGWKRDGTREATWAVFGFAVKAVRPEDTQVGARTISLAFDVDLALTVRYAMGGVVVAVQKFPKEKLACTPQGLLVTTHEHTGVVFDKLPNKRRLAHQVMLRSADGYLVARWTARAQVRTLGIWPESSLTVRWFRFPVQPP